MGPDIDERGRASGVVVVLSGDGPGLTRVVLVGVGENKSSVKPIKKVSVWAGRVIPNPVRGQESNQWMGAAPLQTEEVLGDGCVDGDDEW